MNQTYESLFTGDYLAGLIEGDGMINKNQIIIIFSMNHLAAAKQCAQQFNGKVSKSYKSRSWRVVFSNLTAPNQILTLTQNKWVGKAKIDQIKKHLWHRRLSLKLETKPLSLNNAWLTGFCDADGCFDISIRHCKTCKTQFRVDLRLHFSQKQSFLLTQIQTCLTVKSISQNARHARLYVNGQKRLNHLVKPYFEAFPPRARRFEFCLWLRALELVNQKAHLTQSGLNK